MGTVKVTIAVGDPQGQMFEDLEVTVDTGSTFTAVPRELLRRLGVPVLRSAQSELADGSNAPVEIGRTVIRLEGQEFPTPVIFAEEGEPSLLGVVTLEEALLAVDPVAGRLVPTNVLRNLTKGTEEPGDRNRRRVPNGAGMDLALNGDTRVDSRKPRRRGYLSETEGNES